MAWFVAQSYEHLAEQSMKKGEQFQSTLRAALRDNSYVKEIRGRGLMVAVEFNDPRAHDVVEDLVHYGVLAKDTHTTTIRFTPPLVITDDQLEDACDRILRALDETRMDTPY